MNVAPAEQQITENNKELTVTATSTIRLKNQVVKSFLNGRKLYHGFDIMLDRYEEDGSVLSKIAESSLPTENITATYQIGSKTGYCKIIRSDNDLLFETDNILSDLLKDSNTTLTVTATIKMDFSDIVAAFPEKTTTNPRIGTNVSATSKLSYDKDGLAGSSISDAFPENNKFYYREALSAARLTYEANDELDLYDKYGYASKNYSRLGVNGERQKNSSTDAYMPINSTALFNAASIEDYDYNKTKKVRFTMRLYKKTDLKVNGSVTSADYGDALTIADYLDSGNISFAIDGVPLQKNTAESKATAYVFDTAELTGDSLRSDKRYIASVFYSVKTGENFYQYANYRVELQAELIDENGGTIGNKPSDYIVYTNAKVFPTLIENIGGG